MGTVSDGGDVFGVVPAGGIRSSQKDHEPCLPWTLPLCQGLPPLSRALGLGTNSTDVPAVPLDVAQESLEGAWDEQTKPLGFAFIGPVLKSTPDFESKLIYCFEICFNSVYFASA